MKWLICTRSFIDEKRRNEKILEYVLEESSEISDGLILGVEHIIRIKK